MHSETKENKPFDIDYSKKLLLDIETVKEKLQQQQFSSSLLEVKPKKKDSLENINVFGKGRRLQVFENIAETNEIKKKPKKKNKNKNQKNRK